MNVRFAAKPTKVSKGRIKRPRGLAQPQYWLRVDRIRVSHDVTEAEVAVLAIVPQGQGASLAPGLDVFAMRASARPNAIGLSIVQLARIEDNHLHLANGDVLDATPLLDIKPYVPEFDRPRHVRTGWLAAAQAKVGSTRSDDRFA